MRTRSERFDSFESADDVECECACASAVVGNGSEPEVAIMASQSSLEGVW